MELLDLAIQELTLDQRGWGLICVSKSVAQKHAMVSKDDVRESK